MTRLTAGVAALVFLAGCSNPPTGGPRPPVAITVAPELIVKRDSTKQIAARVVDAQGREVPSAVIVYASGDTTIAKVSATGLLTGVHAGPTSLTLTSGTLTATPSVAVLGAPPCSTTVTQPLTARPFGVAVSRQGVVYVGRASADVLARTDLPATMFSASVAVRREPTYVTFDTTGAQAYVTNQFAQLVSIVDVGSNTQSDSIRVTGNPFIVRVSPDNSLLWVSSTVDTLYAINPMTKAVVARFSMPLVPNGLAFNPANDSLMYASTLSAGTVEEINYKRLTRGRTFTLGANLQGVVVSQDGGKLFVADEFGAALKVVNLASGTVDTTVSLPGGPFDVQLSPDGTQLWISLSSSGRVQVLDRSTFAVLRTVLTGGTPRRMAFDRFGNTIVVANESGWVDFVR